MAGGPRFAMTPVVKKSAAVQVADQIVAAIRDEQLKPGDKLPSERELAQNFDVSRPTIREALAALELAGLAKSYKGRGTVVTGSAAAVATWGVEVLPPQVFEARLAIEPSLAALAAEKRYPEDLRMLESTLAKLEAEFAETGAYSSDLPLHRAIAKAARNPILEQALEEALRHVDGPLWTELRRRALAEPSVRSGHIEEARMVIKHIKAGKTAEAAEVWRQHLLTYRSEILGGASQQ
ncbi:FadR/GntR family transcriptional regulator [Thermoactinospora rubra]|uniref:FadR/GntR family transcriptional regulator n=1 Tax=Thermoactinospora rubra TaxID=1088767 RepID=UPI000A10D259|nr:GntR family transcriptional regulator [Thermoactinospora rubra]